MERKHGIRVRGFAKGLAGFVGALPILLVGLLLLLPLQALADPLDDAKRAGWVGERPDGYLGLVDPGKAPKETSQLVAEINELRRNRYASIAAKEQTSLEVVAVLAGKKLVARAPAGHFVMDSAGRWQRVP
jgi:uncharacterized protein YdbL (DUF1318 family)